MKKSDLIKARIAELRIKAQTAIDTEGTTTQEIDEISNNIDKEEAKLALQLSNEKAEREVLENKEAVTIENTIPEKKEIKNVLHLEAQDVQNYILGKPHNMQSVQNSLGTGTDGSGGVAVGTTLSKEIIRTLKERANAYSFFSSRVGKGNLETIIISSESSAEWVADGATPVGTDDPVTSKIVLKQHRLYKEIELTQQLINSSSEEFVEVIIDIVADAIKDTLEKAIFVGTGENQPTGITEGLDAKRIVTLATAGDITLDKLKAIKYLLDQGDWDNSSWFMDSSVLFEIDNLKDGNGRPLLQPDPVQPTKNILLGMPISLTSGLNEVGTPLKPILVLAHKNAYQTNTQKTISFDIYDDSAYKKKGMIGIASNIYVDGKTKNKNKVAVLVNPA